MPQRLPRPLLLGLALLAGCGASSGDGTTAVANAAAPAPAARATPRPSTALPAEVVAFKVKRDQCDHFRGEDADDDARAAQLARKLAQTCTGTDAKLAALRKRYAGNARVIAALANYDDSVE